MSTAEGPSQQPRLDALLVTLDYAAHRVRQLATLLPSWDRLRADLMALSLYLEDIAASEADTALDDDEGVDLSRVPKGGEQ
jgi:hypothetical protein